jgi:ABC-type Zn uptake system ZnuABC Zn-binding protein ZnuA
VTRFLARLCLPLLAAALVLPTPAAAGEALRITATIPPYAMLARAVAGPGARVGTLVQRGHDPHHFDPTVAAMARLRRADLVIRNGLGMPQVEDHIRREPGDPSLFSVAEAADFAPIHDARGATNPHIWLDPTVMTQAATALAERLARLRPGERERFAANAAAFNQAVTAADRQCRGWLADLPTRRVVTFHPGFDYFFRHYGLEVTGTYLDLAGNEPSPRRIAALLAAIREHAIPALFREPQLPTGPARALADEAGVRLAELDPLGFTERIAGYPDLLRHNARQVRDAYRR